MAASQRSRYPDDNDDYDQDDAYDDRRRRSAAPRDRRSRPPPPGPGPDSPPPAYDDDPPPPSSKTGSGDARPAPRRRRSILVDPDEDSDAKAARRRDRSNSQVRIKPPPSTYNSSGDEDSIDGRYVKHRNGKMEFIPGDDARSRPEPKRRTHDLEAKTDDRNRHFRSRRDDYESDEGEALRQTRRPNGDRDRDRARPGAIVADDDADGDRRYNFVKPKRPPRDDRDGPQDLPYRPRRSGNDSDDDRTGHYATAAAGLGAAAVGANAARARHDRDRRAAPDPRDRYSSAAAPPPRRRYDDDYDDPPPPRSRRPQRRGTVGGGGGGRDERGYDSEGPARRRSHWDDEGDLGDRRPRRREYEDRDRDRDRYDRGADPYDRRRPDPYRDDRVPRRARSTREGARDRDRDRDRDRRDKRKSSGGGGGGGDGDWKKTAGALFMAQAMPIIKKEGGKFLKSQMEGYLGNKGGGKR